MSDEQNSVEELSQEVATPQIIDEGTGAPPEADLNQEILENDVSTETQGPLAKKNSLSSLIGRSFNKQSASREEAIQNENKEIEKPAELPNQENPDDSAAEELGEINQEIDEDLAQDNEIEEEIVLNPFERRKNRFKKGTLKWIKEENQIVSENVDFLEKEFGKLKNVLKVGVATFKSAKEMSEEKEAHLDQFLSAQESLNEWISERRGTYAWQLLAALGREQEKLVAFEKDVSNWVDTQTQDLYEEARDNKKKFLRKFRFSFGGLLLSLVLGYLVNLALTALGLGWIPLVLNFIGITNPISIISQVIGFGAVFSWFFAFVFYFRDYSRWRKRLNREIADARFYLKAVTELSVEKGRLRFLHQEMHEFLGLMAKLLHNPWFISEEWINYEGTRLDATKLPKSMDVAVPREVGAFNDVKTRALEYFISQNWRDNQINQYLKRVGDRLVEDLTEYVQREVLPEETRFNVDSIKPNELAGLKMKSSIFETSDELMKWEDFISEILGPVGSWQQINFSSSGQLENLFDRKKIVSYALIPERLDRSIIEEIKPHVVEKDDKSGVEVIVRVDVSNWIDGDKIK